MRGGTGTYTVPGGTYGIPNTTIASGPYNAWVDDVAQTFNTPQPILYGGTGASNAPQALINLGALPLAGGSMTGPLVVTDTTASVSPTTGALKVAGGAGIAGALNVGGAGSIVGGLLLGATGNPATGGTLQIAQLAAGPNAGWRCTYGSGDFRGYTDGADGEIDAVNVGAVLRLRTQATDRMIISQTAAVLPSISFGVGTSTPQRKFHFVGPNGAVAALPSLGTPDFVLENNATCNVSLIDGGGGSTSNWRAFVSGGAAPYASISMSNNSGSPYLVLATGNIERARINTAGNLNLTAAIPATSTTTGALTVAAGGIGCFGNVAAGGTFLCGATANAAPALDASGQTFAVANGANVALFTPGSGLVLICNQTTGEVIAYYVGGGSSRMIGAAYGAWIDATTTPAAGKQTVAYSGSSYAVYNNVGSSQTYVAMFFRARPAN